MSQQDHLERLIQRYVDGIASAEELAELNRLLVEEPSAAKLFCELGEMDVLIENWMQDAEKVRSGDRLLAELHLDEAASDASAATPHPRHVRVRRSFTKIVLHPIALVLLVGFVVAGMVVYWVSQRSVSQRRPEPVVQQSPAKIPAARLARAANAVWGVAHSPGGETLLSGQRLTLQRGSAEIIFNGQARVILEGPAELTIVDAAACRLAEGKLTAQVPAPARGFKVHTPDGTVTDLGTEFGVYVKTATEIEEPVGEQEQPATAGPQQVGKQAPITEVHVFKGEVNITGADQLPQPPSPIANRPSSPPAKLSRSARTKSSRCLPPIRSGSRSTRSTGGRGPCCSLKISSRTTLAQSRMPLARGSSRGAPARGKASRLTTLPKASPITGHATSLLTRALTLHLLRFRGC